MASPATPAPAPVQVHNPLAAVDARVAAEVQRVVGGRWRDAHLTVVSRTHVEVVLPNR